MSSIINPPTAHAPAAFPTRISAQFVARDPSLTSDPFPATLDGEYRALDSAVEAPWLQAILAHLATLLPSLSGEERTERLMQLAELTCPADWRVQNGLKFSIEGHAFTEKFLRTVPVLTEQEVKEQMAPIPEQARSQLMTLTYFGQSYYFADQFDENGYLIPICQQVVDIFKRDPEMADWDVAMWWVNPTGWLSDACPRQVYLEKPEEVITAATQEILKYDS